jgi:hypothetical protein
MVNNKKCVFIVVTVLLAIALGAQAVFLAIIQN